MTLLASGKVLVAGGSASSDAELFDPAAGSWSPTGSLATARSGVRTTLLAGLAARVERAEYEHGSTDPRDLELGFLDREEVRDRLGQWAVAILGRETKLA